MNESIPPALAWECTGCEALKERIARLERDYYAREEPVLDDIPARVRNLENFGIELDGRMTGWIRFLRQRIERLANLSE